MWSKALNKSVASREKWSDKQDQIIDIMYEDFVEDSIASIQSILEKFDLPRDSNVIEKLKSHSQDNKKDRYGKHTYDMKDFGLDKESDSKIFSEYCDKFNLKN